MFCLSKTPMVVLDIVHTDLEKRTKKSIGAKTCTVNYLSLLKVGQNDILEFSKCALVTPGTFMPTLTCTDTRFQIRSWLQVSEQKYTKTANITVTCTGEMAQEQIEVKVM